jgi:hypothetical protein
VTETLDDTALASHPARVPLSHAKLRKLHPELYSPLARWIYRRRTAEWLTRIEEHLFYGDSRAAVVVSTAPLIVAAYTDEIDCVALLRFDDSLASEYALEVGSRLVTANIYDYLEDKGYESDLIPGPATTGRYGNFVPLIADFLTDDADRLAERKAEISAEEWLRTETLGQTYLTENFARPRDGRPCWCYEPAAKSEAPPLPEKPVKLPYDPRVEKQEVIKRISFVFIFAVLTVLGIKVFRRQSYATWLGFAVFAVMLVVALVDLLRLPRDLKRKTIRGKRWSIKTAYMGVGSIAVAVVLGLFSELFIYSTLGTWPAIAIWLAAFIATLAFYPWRNAEERENAPKFWVWIIYSVVAGFITLALAYFVAFLRWL